jgi:ABC-type multidrug transport system fused ATPase/permease subunit
LATIRDLVSRHPRPFVIALLGASLFAAATVASSWALGRLTDKVIIPRFDEGEVGTGAVVSGLGIVVFIGLTKATGIVIRRVFATRVVANVQATLRGEVVQHYQAVPYSFHRQHPTGELLSHAGNDVDAATEALGPVPYASGVAVIMVLAVSWMLVTDVWLALVGLVLFPLLLLVNFVYQKAEEPQAEAAQRHLGTVTTVAHESFDGALVVKAMGAEALESERFRKATEELRDAKVRVATIRATFEAVLDAVPAVGILFLLPVAAWRVDEGAITTGTVVAFAALFQLLVFPLRLIGFVLGEMPRAVIGHDRVVRVLAAPRDERPRRTIAPSEGPGARVEVRHLGFSYDDDVPVIADVSFSVEPGRTVAVVGPTGCGKSSLLLLLSGLLEPDSGTIDIDGSVAMAFQEAFLFAESIQENVLLGDGEVGLDWAARVAGAESFVAHLPQGHATVVGERGATLSGGQRQRVALARAIARRPGLLLLDDATSAVDPSTEAAILNALGDELGGTTTIVVANRPSTIALADEVLFLEAGRLVDQGTHEELLRRQPNYARMVRAYELDRADREGEELVR